MLRFDDRQPPKQNDGADFQKFVWEALRSGHFERFLAGRYVRPYFAAGNDGAIDHLAIGDHDQLVVECKFFGRGRRGEPAADWREVANTLGANLEVNAKRDINSLARHYRPWFDRERPIKGYWFCTSGLFQPGAQTELRQEISAFFQSFARAHTSLAHLADINIEVFGWNDFDGALSAIPSLRFRWFRELPIGLRPIRSLTEGKTFRKFLDEETLEFFSRDEFNREIGFDKQARLIDERSTLSDLLERKDQTGLVLSGPGGLGKTRLALQLGIDAEQTNNWLVLRVDRNASPEAIEELARAHTTSAQVLLIIDYAEAATSLFGLAQAMERANRDGEHCFRFVATCRASALSAVKEALEDSTYRTIEFSSRPDDHYNNWVVNKILITAQIPRLDEIALICGGLPVMAAFAVFLFTEYPEEFNAQFGQIHHGDDFATWANKRLKLALSAQGLDDSSTQRPLAVLAARLPLLAGEYHSLRGRNDETARLLDLLKADRWIETDGDGIAAAHDIFADVIIARYIFESEATTTDRTGDVLSDAMDAGAFDRALIALNRLAAHKQFNKIDGFAAIRRVHGRNPLPVVMAHKILLKTRIPNYETPIRLLKALPDVASIIAADGSCDGLVAYLAESTAASKDEAWRNESSQILEPFLDLGVERTRWSNIVVRRALRLLPERYRQAAIAWIRGQPKRSETHFLFVAWLRCGLPLNEIASDLDIWLVNGGRIDSKASFVFSAWLDAAAKLDRPECLDKIHKVEAHVRAWLAAHETSEVARFVYKSWLDAAAKLDPPECLDTIGKVEAHVRAWLAAHETSEFARFVYKSWLDVATKLNPPECLDMIHKVGAHMRAWLVVHETSDVADFVYKSWLNAATKLDPPECLDKMRKVEAHLRAWLVVHKTSEVAGFVYRPWLDAAAKLDPAECLDKIRKVEAHVRAWLAAHETSEDAHFVYKSWLDVATKLDPPECLDKMRKVEAHLRAWLAAHETSEVAGFVYKPWIDAAAKLDPPECLDKMRKVEAHLRAWLAAHETSEVAGFVYQPWLDAAAKLDPPECLDTIGKVEAHVRVWLVEHGKSGGAQFVYKSWLDAGGSVDLVRNSMIGWLSANPDHEQTDFVIKAWLEANGDFKSVRVPALLWFKRNRGNRDAVFVLKFITRERELPPDTIEDIIFWCTTFPDDFDGICRIQPIVSHFAAGQEKSLVEAALLVLEHVQPDSLTDKGVRHATLGTIGVIAWKLRFFPDIESRIDAIHMNVLLSPHAYSPSLVPDTPSFALNPSLAQHVARMLKRKIIDPVTHASALEFFADWLAAWPADRKKLLRSAIQMLQQSCPIQGLWSRVGIDFEKNKEEQRGGTPELEQVLEKLSDIEMRPHDWSNIWEKQGWRYFPGEPQLVALARKWLREVAADPSWPFVWEPLFLYFREDLEFVEIALWWLENRGPRERGAWAFVWKSLWDHGSARDRLAPLGRAFLQEYDETHKYWKDVRARLDADDL
jgi:hypothetical protein